MPVKFDVSQKGPFFDLKGQPLKDAGSDWIKSILTEGVAKLQEQLYPGHGVATGGYRQLIAKIYHRRSSKVIGWGKIAIPQRSSWGAGRNEAIIGHWLEAASRRGQATRFRGYHLWRKAYQHLSRLARQEAGKAYARAVQRLT